jgi:hypothetical protein
MKFMAQRQIRCCYELNELFKTLVIW